MLYVASNFSFSFTHVVRIKGNGKKKTEQRKERQGGGEAHKICYQECLKFLEQVYITKRHRFTGMFTTMPQRQMCAEGLV